MIIVKKDKYHDLARERKKQWNMKMSIVPIVIGAFGTVTEGLLNSYQILIIFKHIYLSHRLNPNRHNHSMSEWT